MSEQPRSSKPVPQLSDYPHRSTDVIRFADLDPQGHVNNAVFATYFESGRVAMFRDRNLSIGVDDATFVLVRQEIDFLRELRWPGNVVVGSAILEFGRSSFTVGHGVFFGEDCAATGRATMVMLNASTRRPHPLPQEIIVKLSQWKYRGA